MKRLSHPNRGFSLVEVAIALIIIGVIASFTMRGGGLMTSTKLRSVNDQVMNFRLATQTFVEKYGTLPGDLVNANEFIGDGVENGRGDGVISSIEDSKRFWKHLVASGLLNSELVNGHPPSKIGGYYTVSNSMHGYGGVWVVLSRGTADNKSFAGVLSPEDAYTVDKNGDTGDPTTGETRSFKGSSAREECFVENRYNFRNKNKDCVLMFRIFD